MSLYGDLAKPGAFARALRERSAAGEIILTVADWKHHRWAHNLLLNLELLSLRHHLVLAAEAQVCVSLAVRMRGALGCGYSSWMRRGYNATIDRGLQAYKIHDGHVYHIWWQRWHYIARAVELGYRALSLDSDLSLRVDPYTILRGALRHHELVVAIDSARSGLQLPRFFPAINVGFVYCRDRAGGAAHRALVEVTRSFERLLCGSDLVPLPVGKRKEISQQVGRRAPKHTRTTRTKAHADDHLSLYIWRLSEPRLAAQQVLWEQDTFSDVIETAAFGLTGVEAQRHTLAHIARNKTIEDAAKPRDWHRSSSVWSEGAAPSEMISLPLGPARGDAASGAVRASGGTFATVGGLPKWYLAAYSACPYGNACDGRWARRPTPLGISHMVGERGKVCQGPI